MMALNFDLVYLWVDGSDPAWLERKNRALAAAGRPQAAASTSDTRFQDNDELRYSLRSVERYAPWVRRVHILTDRQTPCWLDTHHPKVHVVDHRDVFENPSHLPSFSSRAIEANIHRIPGLAEHFIYLNDDMFFGRRVKPKHFFQHDGRAQVFVTRSRPRRMPWDLDEDQLPPGMDPLHHNAIIASRKAVKRQTGTAVHFEFRHLARAMVKSHLEAMERDHYGPELRATMAAPFRGPGSVLIHSLFNFHTLATGTSIPVKLRSPRTQASLKNAIHRRLGTLSGLFVDLADADHLCRLAAIERERPHMFCINQSPGTQVSATRACSALLERMFPARSSFER
ncbi:MAG: hypothetical protein EOP38_06285 [Rubrivivax sp.]|nr:MAG: hypothetical protein EOP38_06285 [Rubrivivax sp.]